MKADRELLREFVESQSQRAFTELVGRYVNIVYGTAFRGMGGDAHRADEVTQSVFTVLAEKAGSLARHPVLAGWLHTTTRNVANQTRRKEQRHRKREQEAQMMNELCSPEVTAADWNRLRPVIDDAVAELGETDRDAILLRYFDERKYSEIAAVLNASEDAARMRVERALDKLRVVLSRRGITSTGAALSAALASHAAVTAPIGLAAKTAGTALAGATGGEATMAGLLHAIGSAKSALIGGAAAVVAGFVVYQAQNVRARLVSLEQERAVLQDLYQEAEQRVAALERILDTASEAERPESSTRESEDRSTGQYDRSGLSVRAAKDVKSFTPVPLSLHEATHVAFIIDTSGSMRGPRGQGFGLKSQVVMQIEAILSTNPNVEYVQFFDADGRFMVGRKGQWLPNRPATRAAIANILPRYNIHSNSNPVPAVFRVIQMPWDASDGDAKTSVVILGDELAGDTSAVLARLDEINPPGADGGRRVSIHAVAFPVRLDTSTVDNFSTLMKQIAAEHGGSFVRAE